MGISFQVCHSQDIGLAEGPRTFFRNVPVKAQRTKHSTITLIWSQYRARFGLGAVAEASSE